MCRLSCSSRNQNAFNWANLSSNSIFFTSSFVIVMVTPRSKRILQRSSFVSLNEESFLPLVWRVARKDCTRRRMHSFSFLRCWNFAVPIRDFELFETIVQVRNFVAGKWWFEEIKLLQYKWTFLPYSCQPFLLWCKRKQRVCCFLCRPTANATVCPYSLLHCTLRVLAPHYSSWRHNSSDSIATICTFLGLTTKQTTFVWTYMLLMLLQRRLWEQSQSKLTSGDTPHFWRAGIKTT